ncbi:MAG: hypothetical protein JHC78_11555, partial [Ilumatobacteraceae bacterium]|nr:hypothetical protein [Ilumatobacteraceae bacterium]
MRAPRTSRAITALSLRYRATPSSSRSTQGRSAAHRPTSRPASRSTSSRTPAPQRAQKSSVKEASVVVDKRIHFRLAMSLVVFIIAFVLILGRTVMLQTISRDTLHAASIDQRTRTVVLRADRGAIFDRNGHEIALSVPSQTLFVDPRMVTDPIGTARAIAGILQITP